MNLSLKDEEKLAEIIGPCGEKLNVEQRYQLMVECVNISAQQEGLTNDVDFVWLDTLAGHNELFGFANQDPIGLITVLSQYQHGSYLVIGPDSDDQRAVNHKQFQQITTNHTRIGIDDSIFDPFTGKFHFPVGEIEHWQWANPKELTWETTDVEKWEGA